MAISWNESNSQTFIENGRYFVPDREWQIQAICALLPSRPEPFTILELGCGEGLLAEALLTHFPQATLYGLDGSLKMLQTANLHLQHFGNRFQSQPFDLFGHEWRTTTWQASAIVSSLTIHHLDDSQKAALYRDLFAMLRPGGVLVIADIVQPAGPQATQLAARTWDESVRQRSLALSGSLAFHQRFQEIEWNTFLYPDEIDKPSRLYDQLKWLETAGFQNVDIYWLKAGHAIFGGVKNDGL